MCEHCGCRGVEPIAELMDEHLAILDVSGEIRRRFAEGDRGGAAKLVAELGRQLGSHTGKEERGVFAALRAQDEFVDAVDVLEAEHAAFDEVLDDLDESADDFEARVEALLRDLSQHIDQENLGIFPVAVVTLSASGWELVAQAHAEDALPAHDRERATRFSATSR